ncbi:MAG TPA: ribosome silencing factor [Oceanipulchritudo sp.]|nr:ribosome silencing factor [Oceanipulchritudo sp.]
MPVIATKKETSILPIAVQQCVNALDQKKADQLRVLYVGDISSITDYFIIATGTSNPHLKALGQAVVDALDASGQDAVVVGAGDQSGWVVVDAYDFMVHIFTEEVRKYFNLEGLWKDGNLIEW